MKLRSSFIVVLPRRFQDAERQVLSAYRGRHGIDAAELVAEGPQATEPNGSGVNPVVGTQVITSVEIADEFVRYGMPGEQMCSGAP